ncbi:DUF3422 domain-containing protein [Rhodoferax saidenbachensis]|uniref:Membrane-anchored protein n=1 Tax=Rhodoferax saidenbachensis TaxID=1484693 RepID=A0ABU1ZNL0_9BURK|nr:DUF3422 domain-containing protein [Rhodoferax saidenbachensis]MDR7307123.1 putative membrane-anchored protein [Rhodoferax saidenbachensis]
MNSHTAAPGKRHLPEDDALRAVLHNEVLLRPPPRMGLPVHLLCVVVRNTDVDLQAECAHLALLPGQKDLDVSMLQTQQLRVQVGPCTLRWERHTEFTRYTLMRALPPATLINDVPQQYVSQLFPDDAWLENIPGTTLAAMHLVMLWGEPPHAVTRATAYGHWFAEGAAVAALMGAPPHSCVVTDLVLQPDGFERLLVVATPGMSEPRAGRIAQRLLDIETYRIMALRGLPAAQQLMPQITEMETELAGLSGQLRGILANNQELLDQITPLAARLERSIAEHRALFDASRAYAAIVTQRLSELREKAAPETRTLSELLDRRLAPAIATITAVEKRMVDLSVRISHATALLQTRIQAIGEAQNRHAIATLHSTQLLVRRLQRTVAGLTIAAATYCIVSLLWQAAQALKSGGLAFDPQLWVGALIPLALGGVWWMVRRVNQALDTD